MCWDHPEIPWLSFSGSVFSSVWLFVSAMTGIESTDAPRSWTFCKLRAEDGGLKHEKSVVAVEGFTSYSPTWLTKCLNERHINLCHLMNGFQGDSTRKKGLDLVSYGGMSKVTIRLRFSMVRVPYSTPYSTVHPVPHVCSFPHCSSVRRGVGPCTVRRMTRLLYCTVVLADAKNDASNLHEPHILHVK